MRAESAVIVRNVDVLVAEVDGETVIFHPDRGLFFALGPVGTRIWALLEQPQSAAALCAALRLEFDVDPTTCRGEVLTFLAELEHAELVEAGP